MSVCSDTQEPRDFSDDSCTARAVDSESVAQVRSAAPTQEAVARTTAMFSALSDPTRYRLLEALAQRELCVCDLSEIVGVSQSGVSHQLRVLRDRGLVAYRREAQRAIYRLSDDHVRDLIKIGAQHAAEGARE